MHSVKVCIDTGTPSITCLPASVTYHSTGVLHARISDPPPSCGAGTVVFSVRRGGRTLVHFHAVVYLNTAVSGRFTCRLPRGHYTWYALVVDAAGNRSAPAHAGLTVR